MPAVARPRSTARSREPHRDNYSGCGQRVALALVAGLALIASLAGLVARR